MSNNNNYETYYTILVNNKIIQRIKSNTLGLGFMSDDNFVILFLDNDGEKQFMYIDNYSANIVGYIPELDLTLFGEHLEGTSYLRGNPFNIQINEDFKFAYNI